MKEKTALTKTKEHLQRDVDLGFLKKKDVDRIAYYIDTFFIELEKKQHENTFDRAFTLGVEKRYSYDFNTYFTDTYEQPK